MTHRHRPSSTCQLFVISIALLLCAGSLHSASAQIPNTSQLIPKSPDPSVDTKRLAGKRSDNRSKRSSSNPSQPSPGTRTDDKQQEIEQAIADGNTARERNNYEQALDHYRKAETLNRKEARAFYGKGNVYSDLYCNDSAIEAYGNALELKKDYPDAHISLGYAYVGKERYDEAEEHFKAVLKTKPVNANLGLGYVYAMRGEYQEAIGRINLVINDKSIEDRDRAAAYFMLGAVHQQQRKWSEAIAQYEKAISILRQALAPIDSDTVAQREKVRSLKNDLARIYLSLGGLQLSYAYSQLPRFGNVDKLGTNELEAFRASVKQAINNLDRAKEHGYNHPNLYIAQGRALAFQSNYQEAVSTINTYFEKVKELESQLPQLAKKCTSGFNHLNASGHWWLGQFYFLEGDVEADARKKDELFNKAIEQFKQAIKLKQDFDVAYAMLGLIYIEQGNYEKAISQHQEAIRFGTDKLSKAVAYESIGQAYGMLKNYDEAIRNLQEAIKLNPNNPTLYESLASLYAGQGNLEEIFKLLKKATELRAELKMESAANSNPYYYLGAAYTIKFLRNGNEEDFNEAVKWLKKAIEISPKQSAYYKALGVTYEKHSNTDEAMANYRKAIQYDPKNPEYYFDMADIYFLKHNYDAAIERIRQVIELKQDSAKAYQYLGALYHRKNDDTEAIKQELKAIEIDRKYLLAYFDLADIYKAQKNYSEAIKYLQRAIEIAPTNFLTYKEMAKVYEDQQKKEEAIRYYEEAINVLNADAQAKNLLWVRNLYLGRIERLRGHYAEAIGYFQKLPQPASETPGQTQYEVGVTYVASNNKRAALEQHQLLVQMKSTLAEELLKKINEMK